MKALVTIVPDTVPSLPGDGPAPAVPKKVSIRVGPDPKDAEPKVYGTADSVAAGLPLTEEQRDALLVAIAQRLGIPV